MGWIAISDFFYSAPEVGGLETRAIGAWVRLASYHACFPTYDIPKAAARICGAKPRDIQALVKVGLLIEVDGGWRLGETERELWKFVRTPEPRPQRPPIPDYVRSTVMERDEFTCLSCGAIDDLTLDHIIPWSHGGPDTVENLRVLCRACNSKRGNRVEAVNG